MIDQALFAAEVENRFRWVMLAVLVRREPWNVFPYALDTERTAVRKWSEVAAPKHH